METNTIYDNYTTAIPWVYSIDDGTSQVTVRVYGCCDYCESCGVRLNWDWKYCPYCGKEIKTCSKCGKRG